MTGLDNLDITPFVAEALHAAETPAVIDDNKLSTSDPGVERGRSCAYEEDLFKGLSGCI